MANRAVVVDLLVRTNQFTTGMRRASHDMASETTNMETKTKALQMQIGLLGVGMVAFAAVAVQKWAQFDQAMSRVEATGGEAAKRIEELNEAAKSDEVIALGYSAVEASDAIYELAKAGVSATDILGGGMAGAMSLAAAETMDASESASILASALNQFNLTGDQSAHVADLLVAGAGKAQGSAHDLGFALKQSGLVADQFGLSIEETTGTLAFFASAGLIGSDAGTSLRTMLLHLAGPSTKAAKLMKQIGLEIYGADGHMVDMETLADNLQSSLGTLTEQQKNQALATIFGADATRAASLLYREGGDKVVEWTEKVNDAGYAQEVARKRMDNLSGDLKKLSATWDRSLIGMGKSADAPMRGLVQGITDMIDRFGDMDPAIQGVIMAITGGGGLVVLATLGIGQIIAALTTLKAGLVATGVVSEATATKMTRGFGFVAKGIGLASAALAVFAVAAQIAGSAVDDMPSSEETTKQVLALGSAGEKSAADIKKAKDALAEMYTVAGSGNTKVSGLAEAIETMNVNGFLKAMDSVGSLFGIFDSQASISRGLLDQFDASLTTLAQSGAAEDVAVALGYFNEQAKEAGIAPEKAMELLPQYQEYLLGVENAQTLAGDSAGTMTDALGQATEATEAITTAEIEAKKAHDEYIGAIVDSFTSFFDLGDTYQGVIDGQKEIAQSAADSSESTEDSWENFYDGTTVTFDQYIAKLSEQVTAQETWASNMIALTGRMKTEMPADLQVAAQEMINELRGLGPEGAAQVAMLQTLTAPQLQQVVDLFNRQGVAAGEEWATGVEAAENPEVDVETSDTDKRLAAVAESMLKLDAAKANPKVEVDTTQTMARLAAVQTAMDSIRKRGISVALNAPILGPPVPGFPQHAGGGDISGPGTGTSDSIMAMVSNGEHVLTASDVQKAGGQDAVYRMRAGIQAGMLKFASGGAVNINGHTLDYWKDAQVDQGDIIRLQIQIRDLQADLGKRGKDALNGLDRQQAQWDLGEAQRKLAEGYYANSLNVDALIAAEDAKIDAAEAAQQNAEKRRQFAADYTQDIRRGEVVAGASGSKSGAFSLIDDARANIVPTLNGAAATALWKAMTKAEEEATRFFGQIEAIDEKLGEATDKAKELQSISDSVQNGLVGGFNLDSVAQTGTVNPFTGEITGGGAGSAGKGMLASAQAYASKVKIFASKLQQMADKGFAGAILQEVAAMGVEAGIPAADALLGLDLNDTSALNQAYKDIADFGGQAGQAVTAGFYEGGVQAANGLVAGLKAQKDQVQAAIMDMAQAMQDALAHALGIYSPSRKFRAMMDFVGQGVVLGLDDQQGIVSDASARLFDGVTVPGGGGVYGSGGSGSGSSGDITAYLSDEQVNRLAVAFETGNVRNINAATAQKNRKMELTYGARGR